MLEVADIFRRYAPAYLHRFGNAMLPSHKRVITDICKCRTRELGGYCRKCDQCGHKVYSYQSCGNRHCPKCYKKCTKRWLEKQQDRVLPVHYFHIVFTLPAELRPIVRRHQKILYGVLFRAAADSLLTLAADPQYLGAKIGITAVLHTWSRTMDFHPHVHMLVPGGGISPEGQWIESPPEFLVPRPALTKLFRGKFMKLARKALPKVKFPESLWEKEWGVDIRPVGNRWNNVLRYLGRYVHRIAIANSRIQSIDDNSIVFRYQNSKTSQWKNLPLTPNEFIRRFLQHVLPKSVVKIRYYGFFHQSQKAILYRVKTMFLLTGLLLPETEPLPDSQNNNDDSFLEKDIPCPRCLKGTLLFEEVILPSRGPPS